jgi:cation diffusion facilitator family transporter
MVTDAETAAATVRRQTIRLVIVLVLISAFFFVELIGAKLARSDVLEADAYHLLMDVFALAISLAAMRLAAAMPSDRFTFGLRRAEPLAALANGVLVLGVAVELVRDAIEHLGHTSVPRSGLMLAVATAALVVNGLNAWLLHGAMGHHHGHGHGHHHHGHGHAVAQHHEHEHHDHDHHDHDHHDHAHKSEIGHVHGHGEEEEEIDRGHQLNLRGAWLHLLGDALGSFAAFAAGLAIKFGAPPIVDPLASFAVVAILVIGALRLLRDAGLVLIEAAPAHLPIERVRKALLAVDGITHVERLHVWSLGTGHDAICAHVRVRGSDPRLCARACDALRRRFAVEYVTLQVEVE